jgi:hypothetical protein
MEPIISPWVIYAAHIMESVQLVAILMVIGYMVFLPLVWMFEDMNGGDEKFATFMLRKKWYLIVSLVLLVVIPTKEDILSMLALYYITPDNVQAVQGNVLEFIRQISEAVYNGK